MFGKVAVRIYVKSITLKLEKLTDSVFLQKVIAKQFYFTAMNSSVISTMLDLVIYRMSACNLSYVSMFLM